MSNIAINDFSQLNDAKQLAMELIERGVQFTFCPHPLSISHPHTLKQTQVGDQSKLKID